MNKESPGDIRRTRSDMGLVQLDFDLTPRIDRMAEVSALKEVRRLVTDLIVKTDRRLLRMTKGTRQAGPLPSVLSRC